jgi:hypothetical protein
MNLKPIGQGPRADENGTGFDFLVGWLEEIRDHELERAEGKSSRSPVRRRAERLEQIVGDLTELQS